MLTDPWIAALIALFAWWFSTGAILCVVRWADGQGPDMARKVTLWALPLLILGLAGVWYETGGVSYETPLAGSYESRGGFVQDVRNAYLGFFATLAIWGWIELAFLTGTITGPNTRACPPDVPEWQRFLRAWGTIAYHEMLLMAALIGIWIVAWESGNLVSFWMFAVLFFARVSAKLNLFFGVRKINIEFLPAALSHLPSHFRIAPMNWLFPLSITALSFAVACWLERIHSASTPAEVIGFTLLSAMTALALLEHWFMVLPLPDEKLWRWMLPAPKQNTSTKTRPEDAHGL